MDLNDLIQSVDIVDFISQFVELEQRGEEWWGLSCFKDENTPSFSVRKEPPLFYDYSSGIGGNLYSFVKNYYRCSNREAVEIIKKYAGCGEKIDIRQGKMSATLDCKRFKRSVPYKKKYAQKSNITDSYMERFEIREDKLAMWEMEGISKEVLRKFNVMYDGFSDRLVYPIRNISGEIANIGGRILDPEWKEKGIRKYSYFFSWNGGMEVIYGIYEHLEEIKKKKEVIIFEGCKSVLLAETWGIKNTGALLTSHLNSYQMKLLAWLGCRVVFALDNDVDIRVDKNIQKLKSYVNCEYLRDSRSLLDEKDSPVDKGISVFKELYTKRIRYR